MTIDQKFRDSAVKAYNEKSESKCKDFVDLQSKLKKCTDVLCKDQCFGVIEIKKDKTFLCKWEMPPVCLGSKNIEDKKSLVKARKDNEKKIEEHTTLHEFKTIVIVLESPHVDEFFEDNDGWVAIGPACGKTGQNLYKWLPEVLLNYVPCKIGTKDANYKAERYSCKDIEQGTYTIKLVNAIQHQCSLGNKTTPSTKSKDQEQFYRDDVFVEMWDHNTEVVDSFIERVKGLSPSIIINCCTKGDFGEGEETLKDRVQKAIDKIYKDSNCLLLCAAHPSSLYFKNGLSWVDKEED